MLLCVLVWARPGQEQALAAYESAVLPLLVTHGGRVLSRVQSLEVGDGPTEVHLIEVPDEAALAAFAADPARAAHASARDVSVARTQVLRVRQADA